MMNSRISLSIIMRIKEFGESDLLVTFFTVDRGLLKGVAKGARRSMKRFSNCLNLFNLTRLEYEERKNGGLYFLQSGKLIEGFSGLRSDFSTLSLASYMIELTELLFPAGVIDQNMFELLKNSFFAIDKGIRNDILKILFEARAMTLAGFGIELSKCYRCQRPYKGKGKAIFKPEKGGIACLGCGEESALSPGLIPDAVRALQWMQMHPSVGDIEKAPLTDEIALAIRHVLRLHIQYRVGNRLKTAEFLE